MVEGVHHVYRFMSVVIRFFFGTHSEIQIALLEKTSNFFLRAPPGCAEVSRLSLVRWLHRSTCLGIAHFLAHLLV